MRSTLRRILNGWRALPVIMRDGVGALVLLVAALLPLGIPALRLGELPSTASPALTVALIVLETLPLALRRALPPLALGTIGVAFAATELTGAPTGLGGLGLLIALYSVPVHQRRGRAITGLVAVACYIALCTALTAAGSMEELGGWITFAAVLAVPWCLGEVVRRAEAVQTERIARAAEDAVRAHRATLARELHDVVTHHVTAIVVQADSAQYLDVGDVAERGRTLATVADTGRLALVELRTLLDALDPARDAESTSIGAAGDVATMVGRLSAQGYPVALELPDGFVLPDDARGAAIGSVAREAVTNAMKHARGAAVAIRIREHPLELRVANAMPRDATRTPAAGRGVQSIASRVAETGGALVMGVDGDEFVVLARWDG